MTKTFKILIVSLFLFLYGINNYAQQKQIQNTNEQTIFVFGGDINKSFIKYTASLTHKPKPKICYIPTASADNVYNINYWCQLCHDLSVEPHVLRVCVSSYYDKKTFEEIIMEMDAILIGGGNTLNMMAIWEAQGIDTILKKALEKGIVLAGGSAGSNCMFENGISDSRPIQLSIVSGLSLLSFSHCPHYSNGKERKRNVS